MGWVGVDGCACVGLLRRVEAAVTASAHLDLRATHGLRHDVVGVAVYLRHVVQQRPMDEHLLARRLEENELACREHALVRVMADVQPVRERHRREVDRAVLRHRIAKPTAAAHFHLDGLAPRVIRDAVGLVLDLHVDVAANVDLDVTPCFIALRPACQRAKPQGIRLNRRARCVVYTLEDLGDTLVSVGGGAPCSAVSLMSSMIIHLRRRAVPPWRIPSSARGRVPLQRWRLGMQ